MPSVVYKVLGQSAPIGATPTDLYTVPAGRETIISSITVANRSTDLAEFRVSISVGGAGTSNKDYLYYNVPLPGKDTFIATVGLTLSATDVVRIYASGVGGDNLTFQVFGSELIP